MSRFRFFSDYPFRNRAPHAFDAFEREALETLRQDPSARLHQASGSIFDRRVRLITPIIMAASCVNCHNAHVDSPKRDWKVGEVRGIEEISVSQPISARIFAFKYLLIYFAIVAAIGLAFIALQRHQSALITKFNKRAGKSQRVPVERDEEDRSISSAAALSWHPERHRWTSRSPPNARS